MKGKEIIAMSNGTKDWASESTGDTGGYADRDEHDVDLRSGQESAWPIPEPPKTPKSKQKDKPKQMKKKKVKRINDGQKNRSIRRRTSGTRR